MAKITNTSKNKRIDWLFGLNPNAIENQEAEGQKEFINSDQLPAKLNDDKSAIEQYEKMGIEVIGQTEDDELFLDVILPKGWEKVETDHDMWSHVLDSKGRIRASIFYKAAFYDRRASVNLKTRYERGADIFRNEVNPEKKWDTARVVYIIDNSTGEKIWHSKKHFYSSNEHEQAYLDAENWLNENYPYWKDANAYWD